MKMLLSFVLLALRGVESSCPHAGAPIGSSVRAFYLTSAVYNDTEELQRESSEQLTGVYSILKFS